MNARVLDLVLCGLLLSGCGNAPIAERYGLPAYVEILGSPFLRKYSQGELVYARNPWDLHAYAGRIYVGAGNSSNMGPAQNAGPVPIICFDPSKGAFTKEGTVRDEQIDAYYEFGGQLFLPGHDATWPQGWKLGNVYCRRKNGRWKRRRSIPNAVHVYALAQHEGKLFAALGTAEENALAVSSDTGESWAQVSNGHHRVYALLQAGNRLYAIGSIAARSHLDRLPKRARDTYYCVSEYDSTGQFVPRPKLTETVLFPDTNLRDGRPMKIVRAARLGAKALYIGAYCHNDHQCIPFGVYIASSFDQMNVRVQKIPLTRGDKPWDVVVRSKDIYVLVESRARDETMVKVLHIPADALHRQGEILSFSAPTFARSFEILDGDFYFGLGTEVDNPDRWKQEELHPATGYILRIRNALAPTAPDENE